jgi:hypothetical protein
MKLTTACMRLGIDLIKFTILFCGILCYSSCTATISSGMDVTTGTLARSLFLSSSHRCSMGFRSGLHAGHSKTRSPIFIMMIIHSNSHTKTHSIYNFFSTKFFFFFSIKCSFKTKYLLIF